MQELLENCLNSRETNSNNTINKCIYMQICWLGVYYCNKRYPRHWVLCLKFVISVALVDYDTAKNLWFVLFNFYIYIDAATTGQSTTSSTTTQSTTTRQSTTSSTTEPTTTTATSTTSTPAIATSTSNFYSVINISDLNFTHHIHYMLFIIRSNYTWIGKSSEHKIYAPISIVCK